MRVLAAAAAKLLDGEIATVRTLAGGDLSEVLALELADGREAVVKGGPAPRAEAAMLRAMRDAGVPAPAVLAVSAEVLVLEALPGGAGLGSAWACLGEVLGTLHASRGPETGWPDDYAFGVVAIPNAPLSDWPHFWAERRLLIHAPHVQGAMARRLERLSADLGNRLPQTARALLHGDLWSGNVLVDGDRVSGLIDPACYYGHAEVDIAMLTLFDRPEPAFYEAYGGLEAGHEERLVIYRLWPALVHLRLFGYAYRPLVERLLSAAGA